MTFADLRYSVRNLLRTPGFTAIAVLTLGLGIAANTVIFSVVNGVILKPLGFQEPERLVFAQEVIPEYAQQYPTIPVNARHYQEWRKNTTSFSGLAILRPREYNLTGAGTPERLHGARVSANLFPVLGVQPQLGRNFLSEEDQPGRDRVVILADGLWRQRFGADRGIIGRTVRLDGSPYTVVGVLPPGFRMPALRGMGQDYLGAQTQVFKPVALGPDDNDIMGSFNYAVIGRLKPGVTRERALAELNAQQKAILRMAGDVKIGLRASLVPVLDNVVGNSRQALIVVLAAVGAVLLIVCVNLANLMLARTAARRREAAVRTALGAGRLRLMMQALAESATLALAGGALGLALAFGGLGALLRFAPANLPRLEEVTLDSRVLLFGLALTAATALLAGLVPAWRLSGVQPLDALRAGGRSMTESGRGVRLRNVLIGLEVGLSTVLLIVAGLLMTSFVKLMRVEKGFQAERLMAAEVGLPYTKYKEEKDRAQFLDRVVRRLESVPGVTSVSLVNALPLRGETWVDMLSVPGDNRPVFQRPTMNMRFASPSLFPALGIPVIRGRAFDDHDRSRKVVMLSQRAAEVVFPGQDPIGKKVMRMNPDDGQWEVVGITGEVRAALDKPAPLTAYVPYWQMTRSDFFVILRTAMDPRSAVQAARAAIWQEDAELPVPEMMLLQTVVSDASAQRRFQLWLIGLFAAAATALASMGIYGVVSHAVTRRLHEMGIRMALGANAPAVYRLVLGQGMTPVATGLLLGVAGALALGRLLGSMLFEVSAFHPGVIGGAVLLLALVAGAACLIPARRAARVDPVIALRYE